MTHETGDRFLENIPAYVLDALDSDERYDLEVHLQTCTACQAELASYRQVSENMLLAVPPVQPPAALRKRLQSRLPSAQNASKPRFSWNLGRTAQFGLVGLVVVLLVVNIYSLIQIQSLNTQQAKLLDQFNTSQTALAMLAYPDTQTINLEGQGIVGTLLLDKERNIALITAWNLPSLQADQTYQIWLIDPQGGRTSAGIFTPDTELPFTTASIIASTDLSNYVGLGVTVEPAGGSSQPTGPRIFKVDF